MLEIPHPHVHEREIMMTLDDCDKKILNNAVMYVHDYSGPRGTALDLGAHVGCSALYFAAELGFEKVLAVEAYWENFRWLVNNIHKNKLEGAITPFWAAAASHTGEWRPMYWSAEKLNHGQYSTFFRSDYHPQADFVQTISFEHILSLFDTIDFLKVDIEGGEYEIFSPQESLKNALIKQVRFLDLETHCLGGDEYFHRDQFARFGYPDTQTANRTLRWFLEECGFELDEHGVSIGRMQGRNRYFDG